MSSMSHEGPIIPASYIADAKQAMAKLPSGEQETLKCLTAEVVTLLQEGYDPHTVFERLEASHPEAVEALEDLRNLPL